MDVTITNKQIITCYVHKSYKPDWRIKAEKERPGSPSQFITIFEHEDFEIIARLAPSKVLRTTQDAILVNSPVEIMAGKNMFKIYSRTSGGKVSVNVDWMGIVENKSKEDWSNNQSPITEYISENRYVQLVDAMAELIDAKNIVLGLERRIESLVNELKK